MSEYQKVFETIADDPISLVYSKLIDIALENEYLSEKIKKGNIVRFDYKDNRNKPPEKITTGDTPELTLGLQGFSIKKINSCNITINSCNITIECTFNWLIVTGDYRQNYILNPIIFNLLCSMAKANDELCLLQHNNEPFVMKCDINEGNAGLVDGSQYASMRNLNGWSASFPIVVTLSFKYHEI